MSAVLGLVTIGQTPRPDLEAAFARHAPAARILIYGALDGLTAGEIAGLRGPKYPLLVRLAEGGTAEVELEQLAPRVEACAERLAAEGAGLVVVVCAGGFPEVHCSAPVLLPGRLLPAVVGALYPGRRLGVVTPIAGQAPAARDKWRRDGFEVEVTWASPARPDETAAAAARLRDPSLACIVLDCMGHDERHREEMERLTGRPVLAAQDVVARVAGAVVGGGHREKNGGGMTGAATK